MTTSDPLQHGRPSTPASWSLGRTGPGHRQTRMAPERRRKPAERLRANGTEWLWKWSGVTFRLRVVAVPLPCHCPYGITDAKDTPIQSISRLREDV